MRLGSGFAAHLEPLARLVALPQSSDSTVLCARFIGHSHVGFSEPAGTTDLLGPSVNGSRWSQPRSRPGHYPALELALNLASWLFESFDNFTAFAQTTFLKLPIGSPPQTGPLKFVTPVRPRTVNTLIHRMSDMPINLLRAFWPVVRT
jgi:hypothetical protein